MEQGRLDDARNRAEAWVRREPDNLLARTMKAVVVGFDRDVEATESEFGFLYREYPGWGFAQMPATIRTGLAWALLEKGEEKRAEDLLEEARQWLESTLGETENEAGSLYELAVVSALSGDAERALAWLQEVVERGGGQGFRTTSADPRFDNISDDPRFADIIQQMAAHVDSMRARVERGDVDLGIG
jgi:hypothetical protein